MSIVELNNAGDKLVCSGQKIIKNYINTFNINDNLKYNKIKESRKIFNDIDVRNLVKPNYWNDNLKHILAMENLLLTEDFINSALSDNKHLWNTGNKQLNHVNLYNIKQYARNKLYELNKK